MTTSNSNELEIVKRLESLCKRFRDALHYPEYSQEVNNLLYEMISEVAKLISIHFPPLRLPLPADMPPEERERALEKEVMRLQIEVISLKQEVVRVF